MVTMIYVYARFSVLGAYLKCPLQGGLQGPPHVTIDGACNREIDTYVEGIQPVFNEKEEETSDGLGRALPVDSKLWTVLRKFLAKTTYYQQQSD